MQSYITILMMMEDLKNDSVVEDVPSKLKSKFFNCPKNKKDKNIDGERYKKWLLTISIKICEAAGDIRALAKIEEATEEYNKRDKSKKLSELTVVKPYEFSDLIATEEGWIRSIPLLSRFVVEITED